MRSSSILTWLERNATQMIVQQIPVCRRSKNRCIVQYRDAAGELQSVGGRSLADAVAKAQVRNQYLSPIVERSNDDPRMVL